MIALLHTAVNSGVTFFDTAEVYGPLSNEQYRSRMAERGATVRLHSRMIATPVRGFRADIKRPATCS